MPGPAVAVHDGAASAVMRALTACTWSRFGFGSGIGSGFGLGLGLGSGLGLGLGLG